MKKLLLTSGYCLLLTSILYGQTQMPTYVFALSARQAGHWYQHPNDTIDVDMLSAPIDSFLNPNEEQRRRAGHYLYVRPDLERLEIQLRSYYAYQLEIRNNDRDFAVELIGPDGQARTDAHLLIRKRDIPFDPLTQTYRRKHWKKDGLLTVSVDRDTLFFEITGNETRPLLFRKINYWRGSTVGYWLTTPVRWVENTYRYLKRGIGWGDWNWYRNPFQFLQPQREFRGYIAASQPLYRPGDTLQLKAYLANRRGRPWKRNVRLKVWTYGSSSYSRKTVVDTLLAPDGAGHFSFRLPLQDSLPIDQRYYADFEHARKQDFDGLQHNFLLEDYELDEATFSLHLNQEQYHRGEKIALQAEGRDQNDQFIAGASVQLTLKVSQIQSIYTDSLSIPDTLWTSRQELQDRSTTQLLIPDSLFPAADLSLQLHALFSHPSGELHEQSCDFKFRHQEDKLLLEIEGDSLVARLERNDQSIPARAVLARSGLGAAELLPSSDTISLPYREALRPHFRRYTLETQGLRQSLDLMADDGSLVQVQGTWQPDSVLITVNNPRRLNITWLLQSRTREIRRGSTADKTATIRIPVGNQQQWKFSYEYFWEDTQEKELTINKLDKQLTVAVEQPPRISPGEEIQVKIQVKDAYGRPAADVQLAAAAVNAQFDNTTGAYQAPSIPYKTARAPFVIENFHLHPLNQKELHRRRIDWNWYGKLQLQSSPFYQLRFQNPGVWMDWQVLEQDTFYRKVAQVAPYLVRNGRAVPVYLIYINDRLVYYFGSQDKFPYSFAGRAGYNRISLRARDREYTLDSVWLENGRKLEVAVNLDRFRDGMSGIRLRERTMPEEWTWQELSILRNKTLALMPDQTGSEQYFWDQETNIRRIDPLTAGRQEVLIGPFHTNWEIKHVKRGEWERGLRFEPGFRYRIEERRERLYEWDNARRFRDDFRHREAKPQQPGQLIYRPADIRRDAVPLKPYISYAPSTQARLSGKGRLRFVGTPTVSDSLTLLGMLLQSERGTEWKFPVGQQLVGDLLPGSYQLFLVREDGQVYRERFILRANTTFATDLSGKAFDTDPVRQWPERLYDTSQGRQIDREETPKPNPPDRRDNFEGIGRLIRGRILDADGEPLIGASILIEGTSAGTVTDFDGYYSIWVPDDGELTVSYAGFTSQRASLNNSGEVNVTLNESAMRLEEVVVTGMGSMRRQNLSGSVATVLQGAVAGVEIVRLSNNQTVSLQGFDGAPAEAPLVIIDGRESDLTILQTLPPESITNVEFLSGTEAMAIYGPRAGNGAYVFTLEPGTELPGDETEASEPAAGLREHFRDYAFWQPKLQTDENGEAVFRATFPDNITAWDTYVLGMDRRLRAGIGLARTQSWKSLTARLNVPRFLIAGDEVDITGQAVNYTNDTLAVRTFFREGEREVSTKNHRLTTTLTDSYRIKAGGETADSLNITYGLEQGSYLDGEKRPVRIFPRGSLETEGIFTVLQSDTTFDLSFPRDLPVQIFAADNSLELLMEELDYLKNYPHECMEQTASRLIALALEQQIRDTLHQAFDGQKQIRALLSRLLKAQSADGGWAWWPGGRNSLWITLHVLEAINLAVPEGESRALEKGVRYLVNQLPTQSKREQLQTLNFLSAIGHRLDYGPYMDRIDSLELSLHDRLLSTRIRQRADLPYQLDTLEQYRHRTLYGALYWGEKRPQWFYRRYDQPIATTLIAYDILRGAGRTDEARRVRQYFLENRGIGQVHYRCAWYNTYETARVLASILPDLLSNSPTERKRELRINDTLVDSFPYTVELRNAQQLRLQKRGNTPLYFTAYQQYHNPQPAPKSDVFRLSSRLIQGEREVERLEKGQPASLEVSITADADAEYVMIEIPVPASCSYATRDQVWSRIEDHREYRREKVVIYCSNLPAGTHRFHVDLEARFSGRFTLNPARAEQMYFPVLYGRNIQKQIPVE